jgi:hypothetical protein
MSHSQKLLRISLLELELSPTISRLSLEWPREAVKKLECMRFYQDFLADFKFHPLSIRSMHVLEESEFGKLQKRLMKGHCISIFSQPQTA